MKKISQYVRGGNTLLVTVFLLVITAQTLSAETRYKVKSSDNLDVIVERFYGNSDLSKGQIMVGILANNPRAFKGGNINFLLGGRRLVLPNESEIDQISPEIASKILSQHARLYRLGITGDLKVPKIEDLFEKDNQSEDVAIISKSEYLLGKQRIQAQKIDQLEQESNDLKKQLEDLLSDKTKRDSRLLELEKTLEQTKEEVEQVKHEKVVIAPSELKLGEQAPKSAPKVTPDPVKLSNSNTGGSSSSSSTKKSPVVNQPPTGSSLAKLLWLLPLVLLSWFLFRYFGKEKKVIDPAEDTIAYYEAEYEASKDIDLEFEEETLETSVKLDVARAYIEADDTPSALDILTEVMEEGSAEQREQAKELLDAIST